MSVCIPLSRLRMVLPCAVALAAAVPVVSAGEEGGKSQLPTTLHYASPLAAYRNFAEQPVGSWREANDHVGRVGGWRTYAGEMQEATPTGTPPAEEPAKKDDPHAGHHPEPPK
jgi:hypothetical protein